MAVRIRSGPSAWLMAALVIGLRVPACSAPNAPATGAAPENEWVAGGVDTDPSIVDTPTTPRVIRSIRSPVPVGKPGTELAAAKALMRRATHMKRLDDLPPLLTNDSAAMIGMVFGGVLYMTCAFADGMQGMAQSYGSSGLRLTGTNRASAELQRLRQVRSELDDVFRYYGVELRSGPGAGMPAAMRANGRSMLADMLAIMGRLPGRSGRRADGLRLRSSGPAAGKLSASIAGLRYAVISRSQVRISGVDRSGKRQSMLACVEGGGWRLHILDLAKLMRSDSQARPR